MRPYVVFKPTTPQRKAGTRTEPPPSVPSAAEHIPEATIAVGPDEDPPVYLSGSCSIQLVML